MSGQTPAHGAAPASNFAGQSVTSPVGVPPAASAAAASTTGAMSNQNLNQIVTDYLLKRGFNRTEEVFRQESKHLGSDGKPIQQLANMGPRKYQKAFKLVKDWVENNLDLYKFELSKLLWPIFVYSFFELVVNGYAEDSKTFLKDLGHHFQPAHDDDLKNFSTIALPQHIAENSLARLYKDNKYRIPLNQHATGDLFNFLERESEQGGAVIRQILVSYCQIDSTARGPITPFSFEAVFRRSKNADIDEVDAREGIPGINIGLSNLDVLDPTASLKLGPMPMEADLREDVRAELEDEERKNPPPEGVSSLVEEFDQKIKREESADAPSRADIPLPPSRPRDIMLEMQKVRENRDRFKIEGRTGGVGTAISACMFTFHNTLGSVTSMDFSADSKLVAVGTSESYIRVWSLDGKELPSMNAHEKEAKFNSRKLIGHSGPVYDVSFADSASGPPQRLFGEEGRNSHPIDGRPKLLLSCAADGHVRLWSLEAWACLCLYKSHDGPVHRVLWGPHGHYFVSGGYDKVARVWMQDHASPLRLLVGHDTAISALTWHPNGSYIFSASDETDKTIRMWSVMTGQCVRVFSGHTDYISALECAPNGNILASADCAGNIFFWDINRGTRIKRSRGHGRGGIWSLSFSVESTVLVSGGQDGTIRIWDVESPADPQKVALQVGLEAVASGGDGANAGGAGTDASRVNSGAAGQTGATAASGGAHKKKNKEVMVTPDQISAFPTKKTPVTKERDEAEQLDQMLQSLAWKKLLKEGQKQQATAPTKPPKGSGKRKKTAGE
ncbi:WD40/YVTN repeat-like-containing domain protein [Ophiocordyceps sinensis CO18]|uniref:WD40/YVTN repeat-like-containing domain protein n=1 Tax=Ophiocordyceps sinensis (strain Co18 / CGMCC 3.14243) TaxID=911162 RepID=T5AGA0_OPHSC|nr:WD40/YVTN repeat-like-containing domain protein [Ophiocordyceps sinensis CO18]